MTTNDLPRGPLDCTEKEETYAQMRAQGHTKTKSAKIAYPECNHYRQQGYEAELRERVKDRIRELKEERAESAGLDVHEQVRRYNEIYLESMASGKTGAAMKALERIDAIGGFDAPSKSISLRGDLDKAHETLKGENLGLDIEKFAKV